MVSYYSSDDYSENINRHMKVKFSNSFFDKNNGLFFTVNGYYSFENCNL